jgi:hypothetical protein
MHERLASAFPLFTIARRERDLQNRESDFVLRRGKQAFHIEAKRIGSVPGLIFWPDLQFSKAAELGPRYCLAILLEAGGAYEIFWIWQPISQLGQAERYVEWIWDGRKSEGLPPGIWQPTTPQPQMPPRNYRYCITIDQLIYGSLEPDSPYLPLLKRKIEQAWPADMYLFDEEHSATDGDQT